MDKTGHWSLSPAYDLTFAYNPTGNWTATHQMTVNGKRDHFTVDDLRASAKSTSIKRGRAAAIYEQVRAAVRRWPEFAHDVGVKESWVERIREALRSELPIS